MTHPPSPPPPPPGPSRDAAIARRAEDARAIKVAVEAAPPLSDSQRNKLTCLLSAPSCLTAGAA